MRHLIINLERSGERRRNVVEQFRAVGLDFEILKAIDHRNLNAEDMIDKVDRETRRREGRQPLSDGMIACALSHRKALKRIAEDDTGMAAVFEDDIRLTSDAPEILEAIENLERPFGIIFLHRDRRRRFHPTWSLCESHVLGHIRFSGWGAQGYVVTRQAAQRILEFETKVVHQMDHSLHSYWRHGLDTFTLDPPIVFHHDELKRRSVIHETDRPPRIVNVTTLCHRAHSSLIEEIRKRCMFRKMTRETGVSDRA